MSIRETPDHDPPPQTTAGFYISNIENTKKNAAVESPEAHTRPKQAHRHADQRSAAVLISWDFVDVPWGQHETALARRLRFGFVLFVLQRIPVQSL